MGGHDKANAQAARKADRMTTAPTVPVLADDAQRGSHSVQRLVPHHGQTHLDLFSGIGGFAIAAQSVVMGNKDSATEKA